MVMKTVWHELAEYARWAPSPHNTQPTRLKILSEEKAELYFVKERGLNIGDPSGRFTFATFGIFTEILKIAAASKGYKLESSFFYRPLYQNGDTKEKIATLMLKKEEVKDLNPQLILERKTSRLQYNNKKIPAEVFDTLKKEAEKYGHSIEFRDDKKSIKKVVELNKDSLFFDISHSKYREELRTWLRYSEDEAEEKKDGLDMKSMQIPGFLAKSFMFHHWIYTAPILRQISEFVYVNTMRGISTIAWIQGPYRDANDWVTAGRLMIRLWLLMTQHGVYWQPYGSVITNDEARSKLIKDFGIKEEKDGENMVWLLLRMGYSNEPPRSRRLPLSEIII